MIEMVCGVYGGKGRLIRPSDGPFSLSPGEEKRLVGRGVARYVKEAAEPQEPEGTLQEPPHLGPEKPMRAKKPGKGKNEDSLPELSPEDPVT